MNHWAIKCDFSFKSNVWPRSSRIVTRFFSFHRYFPFDWHWHEKTINIVKVVIHDRQWYHILQSYSIKPVLSLSNEKQNKNADSPRWRVQSCRWPVGSMRGGLLVRNKKEKYDAMFVVRSWGHGTVHEVALLAMLTSGGMSIFLVSSIDASILSWNQRWEFRHFNFTVIDLSFISIFSTSGYLKNTLNICLHLLLWFCSLMTRINTRIQMRGHGQN